MKTYILYIIIALFIVSCNQTATTKKPDNLQISVATKDVKVQHLLNNKSGTSIKTRFMPPTNYKRKKYDENSFETYLQNLPLKPHDSSVYLYNGVLKGNQDVHEAVIDIDVGTRDLQQCADAIMRLRGEYLFAQNQFHELHFNFTNGFNCRFDKWKIGNRVKVVGNKTSWYATNKPYKGYASFKEYMTLVFSYAGTLSLSKELQKVELINIEIGDILIQGGSPGHAVIVVDMAINEVGEKMVLLAQSYMPAQDIHILINPNNSSLSPWYKIESNKDIQTPEWYFKNTDLMRF